MISDARIVAHCHVLVAAAVVALGGLYGPGMRPAVAQQAPACAIQERLRPGSSGPDVVCLQQLLALDPAVFAGAKVTGQFDEATENAVRRFQEKQGITPAEAGGRHGVVDAKTRAALNRLGAPAATASTAGPPASPGGGGGPVVSPPGGAFDISQFPLNVTMTAAPGSTIRYTMANRDPDPKCLKGAGATNNRVYQGPVAVGDNTLLRAVACSADGHASPVTRVTFTVNKPTEFCFGPADNKTLPYRLLRNGAVPNDGELTGIYPFTEITTGHHRLNAQSSATQYAYNVANRCHATSGAPDDYDGCAGHVDAAGRRNRELRQNATVPPFNMPNGATVGATFSSYRSADACTLSQLAAGLGYPPAKIAELTAGTKLTIVPYSERDARIPQFAKGKDSMMEDVCVLHGPYPSNMRGVSLDYEVHDGRAPAMVRPFFKAFVELLHAKGKLAILRANPLTSASQQVNSGIRGNENYMQSLFDFVNIGIPADATTPALIKSALTEQLNLLKNGPAPFSPERVYVLARPNEVNSPDRAQAVRDFVIANHIPMVAFGGTAAALGGQCDLPVNRVLKVLAAPRQ